MTLFFRKSFYPCFIDKTDDINKILVDIVDRDVLLNYHHLLDKNTTSVLQLSPIFIDLVQTNQTLLKSKLDYYIAKDNISNTIYICFQDLLMFDIDFNKFGNNEKLSDDISKSSISDLRNIFLETLKVSNELFMVYKSKNGLHVFCISRRFDYRNPDTIEYMLENYTDFYYCIFAYIRGFCVRLNKKSDDDSFIETNCLGLRKTKNIYKFLGYYGKGKSITRLKELVQKHEKYSRLYSNDTFTGTIKKIISQ